MVRYLFIFFSFSIHAQINTFIGPYSGENKNGYLQPVASLLTASFNTGTVTASHIDSGFHVYFDIIGSASFVLADDLKYFEASAPAYFIPQSTTKASTLLGPGEVVNLQGVNGTVYTFPAGMDLKFLSLAVPQITIGSLLGTQFSARFLAYDFKDDVGKLEYLSLGIRHDLHRYLLKNKNVDISIGYWYQQNKLGTYADLKTQLAQITLGQHGKHWNYFAFAGYQSGKMHGQYQSTDSESTTVTYALQNKNHLLAGLSGGLSWGALHIQSSVSGLSPVITSLSIGLKF
jgi:hypothetical protein